MRAGLETCLETSEKPLNEVDNSAIYDSHDYKSAFLQVDAHLSSIGTHKFHMGIQWHLFVMEQAIKSVSQIKQMNNLQSVICVTQSLASCRDPVLVPRR